MANPFDQFDSRQPSANPFDQFDAKAPPTGMVPPADQTANVKAQLGDVLARNQSYGLLDRTNIDPTLALQLHGFTGGFTKPAAGVGAGIGSLASGGNFGDAYRATTDAYDQWQQSNADKTGTPGAVAGFTASVIPALAAQPIAAAEKMTPLAIAKANAIYGGLTGAANNANTPTQAIQGGVRDALTNAALGYGLGQVSKVADPYIPKPRTPNILQRGADLTGRGFNTAADVTQHPVTKAVVAAGTALRGDPMGALGVPRVLDTAAQGLRTTGRGLRSLRGTVEPLTAAEEATMASPQMAETLANPFPGRIAAGTATPLIGNRLEGNNPRPGPNILSAPGSSSWQPGMNQPQPWRKPDPRELFDPTLQQPQLLPGYRNPF